MKTTFAALVLFLLSSPATAEWDARGNPDERVSFAMEVSNGALNGRGTSLEHLNVAGVQRSFDIPTINEVSILSLSPSMRFPVSHNLTLDLRWTYLQQDYSYVGKFAGLQGKVSGEIYTLGFRYYFED